MPVLLREIDVVVALTFVLKAGASRPPVLPGRRDPAGGDVGSVSVGSSADSACGVLDFN